MAFHIRNVRSNQVGAWVACIALLYIISAATRLEVEERARLTTLALMAALLSAHAALYVAQPRLSQWAWVIAQGVVLFMFTLLDPPFMLTVALWSVAVLAAVRHPAGKVRSTPTALAAIVLGVAAVALSSDLYRGVTLGLIVAVIAFVGHALYPQRDHPNERKAAETAAAVAAPTAKRVTPLTSREVEVLRFAAAGSTTSDIAARLDISERTVKAHLSSAYQKLGVKNRAQASAEAARLGLLA